MNRRIVMAVLLTTALCGTAMSAPSIVGKWKMIRYRTVIGTGPSDIILQVSGQTNAFFASYSFGSVGRVRTAEGRFVTKADITTFDRLPMSEKNGMYSFTIPEKIDRHGVATDNNPTFQLMLDHVDGTDVLVIVPDGDKKKLEALKHKAMFWRMKDNN